MKTILVPTDFSAAATHATAYAAALAKAVNASVTLLHAYQLPVAMTDMPVLAISAEELKQSADAGLQRAKEAAAALFPDVPFETQSRLGDAAEEANEICKTGDVFALVAGVKHLSGFERFLFGSTTLSLVKGCSHPVIAVPEGAKAGVPKTIALAVDFLAPAEIPAEKISAITAALQARLHVIHVETEGEPAGEPQALLEALRLSPEAYHPLREKDITQGIKLYAEENNIDLVMVLPHKHAWLERLFAKGHTPEIVQSMPVPVMTLQASK